MPYSMPLWTILTKCPEPWPPQYCVAVAGGASVLSSGSMTSNADLSPPTIRQ